MDAEALLRERQLRMTYRKAGAAESKRVEVDFAETLEWAARQRQSLEAALPAIARCIGPAAESRQGTLLRVIQALNTAGVALAPVAAVLERTLPKLAAYQREALTTLLMKEWLERGDWARVSTLLRRRLHGTELAACEALSLAGQGGLDLSPALVDAVRLLESRNEFVRSRPLHLLEAHFERTRNRADEVVAALGRVRASPERDRLLARLTQATL